MVALQVQGFCWILVIFLAPIIPRIGLYGLKYKAFLLFSVHYANETLFCCLDGTRNLVTKEINALGDRVPSRIMR